MKYNKKALQAHILIIIFISIIMSALIISVFSSFFQNDHQNCQNYEFEITNKCVDGNVVSIYVKNTGNSLLNFKTDNPSTKIYEVPISSNKRMDYNARDRNAIKLIPFYKDVRGNEYDCKGKSEDIQLGRLIKCSR